ncbi:hypothetical protein F5B19DRAFT_497410 [Rostrohypoxylon terebratum]|nr:hypothetical protein F5B19DRAFT_497410 [Rostrohypoxylon terebratum]
MNAQQSLALTPQSYPNQSLYDLGISLDTKRLHIQHNTEGYRDGITAGKSESIQLGFDDGFNLGANLGIKAGFILGLLEGVATALKETGRYGSTRIDQLLLDAEKDLNVDSIFSEQYWSPDGGWKFLVQESTHGGEISSEDVAKEHPVIMKWEENISQEVVRWRIDLNMPIFGCDATRLEKDGSSTVPRDVPRAAVDW